MIKKQLSDIGFKDFAEKYSDRVTDIRSDRIYTRCILPGHDDRTRSAVLYKSGLYVCPVCGIHRLNLDTEVIELKGGKTTESKELFFPISAYPLHFYKLGDVIGAANVVNNKIVGLATRIPFGSGRRYICSGEPGFRLFAPIITESLTDAITLIEHGIDAGAICSVANWHKIPSNALYVPQNDKAGLDVVWKIKNTVIWKWWWKLPNFKDISEIPKDVLSLLLEDLRPNYCIK
jgi:hypothetical protein